MYNGMQVYRAVVTSSSSTTGSLYVSIPSVLGTTTSIAVSTIGRAAVSGVWTVPDVGDQVVVAVEDDKFSNVFLLYPVDPQTVPQTFTYKVGDTGPGGGTIFFVDRFNEYADFTYLELAPSSTQTLRTWAPSTPTNYQNLPVTGADSKALGAGYQNTIDIVAQGHTNPATSAARYCSDLVSGGQSDWYLPSVGEMKMICEVAYLQRGITTLLVDTYWTSSETSSNTAWYVNFISTEITQVVKSGSLYVRPVRRF